MVKICEMNSLGLHLHYWTIIVSSNFTASNNSWGVLEVVIESNGKINKTLLDYSINKINHCLNITDANLAVVCDFLFCLE